MFGSFCHKIDFSVTNETVVGQIANLMVNLKIPDFEAENDSLMLKQYELETKIIELETQLIQKINSSNDLLADDELINDIEIIEDKFLETIASLNRQNELNHSQKAVFKEFTSQAAKFSKIFLFLRNSHKVFKNKGQ